MHEERKQEIIQRLDSAQATSQQAYYKTNIGVDLHSGTQIANMWIFVAAGYSGIEQTFKFLIATENDVSVRELLKDRKYWSHNLVQLFLDLNDETRENLEEFYSRFRSLHNQIEVKSLHDFLSAISGLKGKGYEIWRYSLIEPIPVPRNSIECMLSVWRAAIEIVEYREFDSSGIRMPEKELCSIFHRNLNNALRSQSAINNTNSNVFFDTAKELNNWFQQYDHPINAFADLIWNCYRGISTKSLQNNKILIALLAGWLESLSRYSEANNNADVKRFVERAQGKGGTGMGIKWNIESARFDDVPWNAPEIVVQSISDTAIKMVEDKADTRIDILRRLYRDGFEVRECGPIWQPYTDKNWRRTVIAEKPQVPGKTLTLALWEKIWDPIMYVELTGIHSEDSVSLRNWIHMLSGNEFETGGIL